MDWKRAKECVPSDDETVMVTRTRADGKFAQPSFAYYDDDEKCFFSIQALSEMPLLVEFWSRFDYPDQPTIPKRCF